MREISLIGSGVVGEDGQLTVMVLLPQNTGTTSPGGNGGEQSNKTGKGNHFFLA